MKILSIILGKIIRALARIKGGGSALPGLVIEKINPNFLNQVLSDLPYGIIVVTGTNGKTTTTKMLVELFQSQGLNVFTNKTGSNFVRGIIASAIESTSWKGKINSDIAILELDEAHAVKFIKNVDPSYSLLLNVMRDQLDRFGEIDYTASLLQKVGNATEKAVLVNGCDHLLSKKPFKKNFPSTFSFGYASEVAQFFPNDDELYGGKNICNSKNKVDFKLLNFSDNSFEIELKDGAVQEFTISLNGAHNMLNITAALSMFYTVMEQEKLKVKDKKLANIIKDIKPAFGRGETLEIGKDKVEIMLVKNPAGFRVNLLSHKEDEKVMIAINDNYADGRDMSWLWDVDFSVIKSIDAITGIRAYDMALRLMHDDVDFQESDVNTNIAESVNNFLKLKGNKKIYATYTAMLEIRKELSKNTKVERVL